MKFADNLKKIRKSRKISQEQLAEKVGVSRQSVSKWETSEAYPEMNNILELCKIFRCNINDLINDNIIDLDSLDEEVKMSVAKLKKEKQKEIKNISNILSLIGKIAGIVLKVVLVFTILAVILIPIAFSTIDVENGKLISNNNIVKIVEYENSIDIRVKDSTVVSNLKQKDLENIIPAIKENKTAVIIYLELGLIVLCAFMVVMIKVLKHLELLFKSINEGNTPFTLENVEHIKKMTYLMIAAIILSAIGSNILNIPIRNGVEIEINLLSITEILFLYSMSLIFEYGYEIQLDSKGKLYDEE